MINFFHLQQGTGQEVETDQHFDVSPEDRQPIPRRHGAGRSSGLYRSDDFVDIPLNSPALRQAVQAAANGHANSTPSVFSVLCLGAGISSIGTLLGYGALVKFWFDEPRVPKLHT